MVRIINLTLQVCNNNYATIFRSADVDATTNILLRRNMDLT